MIYDEDQATREAAASLTGFGKLQRFLDDPAIEEIWINAPTRIFVARNGVPELTTIVLTEQEVHELVERMLQSSGRRVDLSPPIVDASLPDGSRLHEGFTRCSCGHEVTSYRRAFDNAGDNPLRWGR